jgi:hypothetical protein
MKNECENENEKRELPVETTWLFPFCLGAASIVDESCLKSSPHFLYFNKIIYTPQSMKIG